MTIRMTVEETAALVRSGEALHIAGEENLLAQLPAGRWIGGTIPYFVSADGGQCDRDGLLVTPITVGDSIDVKLIDEAELERITEKLPANGLTLAIVPGLSPIHKEFALKVGEIPDLFSHPLVGWISGVHLDDLGKKTPKVFDGTTQKAHADKIALLCISLPETQLAEVGIVNLFTQGSGSTIVFDETAFEIETATIDGVETNFADWLVEKGVDTRWPLVADYSGEMINVSFQDVDREARCVKLYAPVIEGVEYRLANPIEDYRGALVSSLAERSPGETVFGCNCILNYLYGNLEGQQDVPVHGPATFGEIAFILLNQTVVYASVRQLG